MRGKKIDWLDVALATNIGLVLAVVILATLYNAGINGWYLVFPFLLVPVAVGTGMIFKDSRQPEYHTRIVWEITHQYKVGRSILVKPEGLAMLPFEADPDWAVKGKIVRLQTEPTPAYVVELEGHEGQIALAEDVVHLLPPPDTQPAWTMYCFHYLPERIDFSDN